MNYARHSDKAAAILSLVNEVIPFDDRKLVEGNAPVELGPLCFRVSID